MGSSRRVRLFTTLYIYCLLAVFIIQSLKVVTCNLLVVSYILKTEESKVVHALSIRIHPADPVSNMDDVIPADHDWFESH
jgi:hypothetical protein